ncbi:regulatory protein IclR (plasmid) [Streptantibioticus cattleyicolor NRRL 8057 = DSM 46488]|uniref:Regulatory protein IclR n=1 Tax=Streptantibioticus cattleyicolor (strain ATCC 35852 / DSM 46488 / JCM 4925 / NBRC 14057 / NRRL 8057) TaxID=1003195 RepID=G8XHJ6_STREN|nr:regulatory protein IclR [Streptantibioticus cattleyicolor NRRL 8057 = DSM 46488]
MLEHVAGGREPMTAMAIAAGLGLDKSTCSRSLAVLVERGWLVRDERTRLFGPGPVLVGLAATAAVSGQLQAILLPTLARLRDATDETVSFHRRVGDRRVCVAGLESRQVIRRVLPIGDSFPLPVGPSGKVILAFVDSAQRETLLAALDPAERSEIRSWINAAIRTGVVSTDGDHIAGVGAASVPVFGREGVFGSLTVAGPLPRWNAVRRTEATGLLLAAARSLSETLGGARLADYERWIGTCAETPATTERVTTP